MAFGLSNPDTTHLISAVGLVDSTELGQINIADRVTLDPAQNVRTNPPRPDRTCARTTCSVRRQVFVTMPAVSSGGSEQSFLINVRLTAISESIGEPCRWANP